MTFATPRLALPRFKWHVTALLAVMAMHAAPASAQALGQARVLSRLGDPFAAEIELLQVTPAQLASLRARMATPAEFASAGMTYNQSLQGVTFSIQRRADGRTFLRLAGAQPVNDLFLEMMVQVQGSGPPVWRDYTLLFEPAGVGTSSADTGPVALGQARVLSGLGQPLRAEVDLPQFPAGNAAGVRAGLAPPSEFQAAGIPYSPDLRDLQLSFRRRPDGSAFLSITSAKPMTMPSLDLLLEANSSSGRVVRDYSFPLTPPVSAGLAGTPPAAAPAPAPAAPAAPSRSAAGVVGQAPEAVAKAPSAAPTTAPAAASAAAPAIAAPASPSAPAAPAISNTAPAAALPSAAAAPNDDHRQVQVKAGDTASRIAMANKPPEISLDQMLVAMLRANPDAFMDGNVNRLKAGATLKVPSAQQAAGVSPGEATAMLQLQSRNFDEFRRKLAGLAPTNPGNARQSSGKVEAKVVDQKPTPPSPNRLSLSEGAVGSIQADIAARARRAEETTAKLAREIKALSQAQRASAAKASASAASAAVAAASAPRAGASAPAN